MTAPAAQRIRAEAGVKVLKIGMDSLLEDLSELSQSINAYLEFYSPVGMMTGAGSWDVHLSGSLLFIQSSITLPGKVAASGVRRIPLWAVMVIWSCG